MDESVIRALARWPDVPAVYGWLELDRRGRWRLRGEPITHPGAIAFIGRNYHCEPGGCWYFQNGPQRVYVALEYTPWVHRFDPHTGFSVHTGAPAGTLAGAWLDERGALLLAAEHGVGVLDDRDLGALAGCLLDPAGAPIERAEDAAALAWGGRRLALERIESAAVARRFGFVDSPREPAA